MDIDVIVDELSISEKSKKVPHIYIRLDTEEEIEMMTKLMRNSSRLSRVILAESNISKPKLLDYIKPNIFTQHLVNKIYFPLRRLYLETKGGK